MFFHRASILGPIGAPPSSSPLTERLPSSSTTSPRATVSGTKLMPKVGREGSGASKKWIGKLLVKPPSENQHRCSSNFPSPLLLVTSAAYSGTALRRKGKLKLIRAPRRIGKSSGAGRGR